MKYTDYSIEAILGENIKQELCKKTEIKDEINDDDIMKYYKKEKYPTVDQLENISLQLDIKMSTLKAWYRIQRQQERKTPSRAQKCPELPSTSPQERTITPPHPRTITPPHPSTITPPHRRTTTPPHPYFQLISEKIGLSPPQINENVNRSPRISPSQHGHPALQYTPTHPDQRFPIPFYHPFSQPYSQLYYSSPHFQFPVSTSSSSDNIQPLDLSKPARQSSPGNHSIKQARQSSPGNHSTKQASLSGPENQSIKHSIPNKHSIKQSSPKNHSIKQSSPKNHSIKQTSPKNHSIKQTSPKNHSIKQTSPENHSIKQISPENHGIKQSNSPEQLNIIKSHSPNNPERHSSPNLSDRIHQNSPEHQASPKTSPEQINQAGTNIRSMTTKTSKARSTPPALILPMSPPENSSIFGSGLRQLVI